MASAILNSPCTFDDLLGNSTLPELRRLSVTIDDDTVVINGRVSTYYLKQLAQESLRSVVEHRKLVNRVVVSAS